jgi:methionyl aminopeptidase
VNIFLKTEDEIDLMYETNQPVGATLAQVGKHIKEGGHYPSFDCFAHKFIRDHGCPELSEFSSFGDFFSGKYLYLCQLCSCTWHSNEQTILREGDISPIAVAIHHGQVEILSTFKNIELLERNN